MVRRLLCRVGEQQANYDIEYGPHRRATLALSERQKAAVRIELGGFDFLISVTAR